MSFRYTKIWIMLYQIIGNKLRLNCHGLYEMRQIQLMIVKIIIHFDFA